MGSQYADIPQHILLTSLVLWTLSCSVHSFRLDDIEQNELVENRQLDAALHLL